MSKGSHDPGVELTGKIDPSRIGALTPPAWTIFCWPDFANSVT